jgi:predicted transcriptional regulator
MHDTDMGLHNKYSYTFVYIKVYRYWTLTSIAAQIPSLLRADLHDLCTPLSVREAGAAQGGCPGSLFRETISAGHAYRSQQARAILRESCLDLDQRSVDLTPEGLHRTIQVTEENQGQNPDMLAMAGEIVAAYVSNNRVSPAELPGLIGTVHAALNGIANGAATGGTSAPAEEIEKPTAAQIRKSIRHEGLVSFIDGKAYKTLKRHLTKHGLDPRGYRAKFGLPDDYPTTAAAYSEARSTLAKQIGLGSPGRRAA